jgi:hypothetical protein
VRYFTFLFSVRRCLICDDDAHFASLVLTGVSFGSAEKEIRRNSGWQNYSPLAFLISFTRRLDYSHQKRRCCCCVLAFLELLYRNSLSLGAGGGGGGELFLSGCSSSRAHFIFWLILLQLFSATLLTEGEREL